MDPALLGAIGAVLAIGLGVWFAFRARSGGPTPAIEEGQTPARPSASGLDRLREGLARTTRALGLGAIFGGDRVDQHLYEALEDALISADAGVKTTTEIIEELKKEAGREKVADPPALRKLLQSVVARRLGRLDPALRPPPAQGPHVILVVGVNGSGKTTTIGKLASRFRGEGKKVMLGAGDTFRAGAIEQLKVWAERSGAEIVSHQEGADPAAVLFDTLEAAKARKSDVVICDTAGRLQSKKPLMDELGKVVRVIGKAVPGAPHEVLLVLDGTMGQNAMSQARTFGEVAGVTGVVLTKLDGTAKGGVILAISGELGLPVKLIGVGEKAEDLRPFDGDAFSQALLGESPAT